MFTVEENFWNTHVMGENIFATMEMNGVKNSANFSGALFANDLGVISPTARMTTSMNTVDIITPMAPNISVKMKVHNEDDMMLTRLLPTRIVVRSLS